MFGEDKVFSYRKSVASKGFDYFGIYTTRKSVSHPLFASYRETYTVPPSVDLLCPLSEDRHSCPRRGSAVVHMDSLQCALCLPLKTIVHELLPRLGVHASHMIPPFFSLVAMCHIALYEIKKRTMTVNNFWNLVTIFMMLV